LGIFGIFPGIRSSNFRASNFSLALKLPRGLLDLLKEFIKINFKRSEYSQGTHEVLNVALVELFVVPHLQSENTRFRECSTCFGCGNKTGLVRILVILQDRTMFSHIHGKLSPRPFK